MSTRVRFIALMGVVILLLALILNSHSSSTYHAKNPRQVDMEIITNWTTAIMVAGVLAGLIMLIVLFFYFRDTVGTKGGFKGKGPGSLKAYLLSIVFLSLVMSLLFHLMGQGVGVGRRRSNAPLNSTCMVTNGTALNCTIPNVGPLATANGTSNISLSNSQVFTHLWLIFLSPILVAFIYLGFYYYRLGMEERRQRRKVHLAMDFDRKLDDLGLDRFSDPKEAVVGIYKNAVLWLEGLGIPYRESWTHWEHAEHVRYMHEAFVELTRLFEKAKYAPGRLTWEDARKALEVYNRLRGKAYEFLKED
ncbi:DUF4129 domain-containing protein [Thermococcus sp.]|uniref:DUF4129 domain-containing protein n=1 Tax=Thermococcus sp. TaxID=35749 RepID=UPI0025F861CE|nr:DUF4129 domain-containing protein [Thermococcus sp.]